MVRLILSAAGLFCIALGLEATAFGQPPTVSAVPEINPGSVASALSVLGAGLLMLRARLKK